VESWPELAVRIDRVPATIISEDVAHHGPNALRETVMVRKPMALLADAGWLVMLPEGKVIGGIARKLAYPILRVWHAPKYRKEQRPQRDFRRAGWGCPYCTWHVVHSQS
jgi:hypothetical protein